MATLGSVSPEHANDFLHAAGAIQDPDFARGPVLFSRLEGHEMTVGSGGDVGLV